MPDVEPLASPPVSPHPLSDAQLQAVLSPIRRHLHQHPELGFQEVETSRYVQAWLRHQGFTPYGPLAETGFYVEIEGAHPGPSLGYRADMDALPVQDAKEVDYASQTAGVAHLCGHDAHTAVACGVALMLREQRERLHGRVRVLFQPNEERSPSGAPRMVADGALDGLGAIYAIHVDPTLAVGRFGLREGPLTAGCSPFVVRVTSGEAGHSARPHEAVDTVWLATQILQQFYQLAGRVTDARRTAVVTCCVFRAGEALNVIPDTVEFAGTLRCIDGETMTHLRDKMRRAAGTLGALYGADVDVDYADRLPPVVNDAEAVALARETVVDLYGAEAVRDLPLPSMGGEDFAFYLERLPGAMVRVGSASGRETRFPLHHARFDVDEAALPRAARLMAEVLLRHGARAA
ncbi:MAG: amidohydrolase [Rubricoccaceae bacterium]|nr:amidohydrolase [Rubricoccaceae bacterium]